MDENRAARDARVKQLDRMRKSELLGIMNRLAKDLGAIYIIGGPRFWSKDELINGILEFEFPENVK